MMMSRTGCVGLRKCEITDQPAHNVHGMKAIHVCHCFTTVLPEAQTFSSAVGSACVHARTLNILNIIDSHHAFCHVTSLLNRRFSCCLHSLDVTAGSYVSDLAGLAHNAVQDFPRAAPAALRGSGRPQHRRCTRAENWRHPPSQHSAAPAHLAVRPALPAAFRGCCHMWLCRPTPLPRRLASLPAQSIRTPLPMALC